MGNADYWAECYDPAGGMSPNQFSETFCKNCMNAECQRSAAEGTSWFKRVSTQEDRLLNNPNFADPRDSKYRSIAGLDFKNVLREAIALEIADRRGDWSIPSAADIAIEASRVAAGQPLSQPAIPPPIVTPQEPDTIVYRTTIKGQAGDYEVTLNNDGAWACTCPAFKFAKTNPCKHITQAETINHPTPLPEPKAEQPVPVAPPPPPPPAAFRPPPMRNTVMPPGGVMADGTPPPVRPHPAPQTTDPWSIPIDRAPPPKGTVVIPVGGKIIMGKGNK